MLHVARPGEAVVDDDVVIPDGALVGGMNRIVERRGEQRSYDVRIKVGPRTRASPPRRAPRTS